MGKRISLLCRAAALAACLSLAPFAGAARQPQPQAPAAGEDDRVYKAKEVDERASVNERPGAEPPVPERCGRDEGRVRLRAVMHKSGEVRDVTVVRASGCPEFDEGAVKAVRKLTFRPAKKAGRPVSQSALFEFNYQID